jgi:hypothetical protein
MQRKQHDGRTAGARPALIVRLALLVSFGLSACSMFKPPDTRVVGQTLGTLLAVSYAASLTNHALTVGSSPCYDLLLSDKIDTGGIDLVTIAVTKECGFPFPGQAEGAIQVAGFGPASAPGFGIADFSAVRVDGRPLPITRAKGYLAVPPEKAPEHGITQLPSDNTLIEKPTNPLIVVFIDMELTSSANSDQIDQGRIDEWFAMVDQRDTPDSFSDDSYWIGGQRASFTSGVAEVAQEFVAFSSSCRANPQLGFVQLARASEVGKGSGIHYLIFAPECRGSGFVALSLSENFLSTGQRVPLDLLGPK